MFHDVPRCSKPKTTRKCSNNNSLQRLFHCSKAKAPYMIFHNGTLFHGAWNRNIIDTLTGLEHGTRRLKR